MKIRPLILTLGVATLCTGLVDADPPAKLALQPGQHISIVGSGVADRLQHSGWLETLIQAHLPKDKLVFRNLAVSGDEVGTWHRSQDFGSREEWLGWTQADVIFAFYGFNESFKGYAGIEDFKKSLDQFLKEQADQDYGGHGAPRIVLFSPIAAERTQDPNYPDPQAMNTNLQNYTAAMAEVARANNVQFVDLYTPSQQAYKEAAAKGKSLTIDGFRLSEEGEKAIAPAIFRQLFGEAAPTGNLDRLHDAVIEKNEEWHSRYRTIDGYNVYGGRSRMAYAAKGKDGKPISDKVLNNTVMQREMQQRDIMTVNRDALVWARAQGKDLTVKDDNLPPSIPVGTDMPGDKSDFSWTWLSGEEALSKIKPHAGCKVNLFADETMFPELAHPVQMAWDAKGRLWVAAWANYPERTPTGKIGDKILILEDTKHTGKADKCTVFLDNLNAPTGFAFYKDGILLMEAPDLWYVPIDKATGKAGPKERVLGGIDSADSHHTTNAMGPDPTGAVYLSDGVFHRTQIETAEGPKRNTDGGVWRFEPRTGKVDLYISYGFANPHGKVWDRWGNDIITDATGNASYFGPAFSGRLDQGKHPGMEQFWKRPSRPCPATGMVSSRQFPDDWQGNFLNCNVISFQGIYMVGVSQDGSGLKGETLDPLVQADPNEHPTFRPICVSTGPDGAMYFCDWSQIIIGHLQHHLRDPNRDHTHGRIYRITYDGRPLLTPPQIDGQPIAALLDLLKSPEDGTRLLAKIELGKHDSKEVVAALDKWVASLDKNDPNYEHNLLEALWVHQWHNHVDQDLLKRELSSSEPRARAAAVHTLCYWRDRVPDALALLKKAASDEDPRVRLQAVRAASFFDGSAAPEAIQVAFESLKKPSDYYLKYVFNETMRQLRSIVKDVTLPTDPNVLTNYVSMLSDNDLFHAPENEQVLIARMERPTSDLTKRDEALRKLVKLKKSDPATELIASLHRLDAEGGSRSVSDLGKLLSATPDLAKVRTALSDLADKAQQQSVRRAALAAEMTADANPEATWASAKTPTAREQLIGALSNVSDPTLRAKFQHTLVSLAVDPKITDGLRQVVFEALPLMGLDNNKGNYTLLANALRDGTDRAVAARAIMQIPRDSWDKSTAGPICDSVLAWAKTVPDAKRSDLDYVETLQVARELAGYLPADKAASTRKELRKVSVAVFVVKTVQEQMRYDTTRLVVEVGKPFEVIFQNGDAMPHNFVIVKPGTRQSVAEAAQSMAPTSLDKEGRAYIPKNNNDIVAASKTLEPGQKEELKVTAPNKEGEYEYVCTFPGHWPLMWGHLVVTKDVDAYLEAHPQAPPTAPGAPAAMDHSMMHHHTAAAN
jgi:azurin/lysophospholipase L1-like esterase